MNLHHQPKPVKFSTFRPICFCLEDINADAPIFQFRGYPNSGQTLDPEDWVHGVAEWNAVTAADTAGKTRDILSPDDYALYLQSRYNNWAQPNVDKLNKVCKLEGGTYRLHFKTDKADQGTTGPVRVRISFWRVKMKQLATQMLYDPTDDPTCADTDFQRKLGVEQFTLPSLLGTFSQRMETHNMRNFMYLKQIGGTQQFTIDATPGSKYPQNRWIRFRGPKKVINPRYVTGEVQTQVPRPGMHNRLPLGQRTWCVIETDIGNVSNPMDLETIATSHFPQVQFQRLVKWRDQTGGAQ